MHETIHIGKLVSGYIAKNKISKAALSRALNIAPSNLEVRLRKEKMPTDFLLKISQLLKHNFFADIAETLPAAFSTTTIDTSKDEEIAALKTEMAIIERERNLLLDIISNKIKS